MIGITNAGGGKDRLKTRLFCQLNQPYPPKDADLWVETSHPVGICNITHWQSYTPGWNGVEGEVFIWADPAYGDHIIHLLKDKHLGLDIRFGKCWQWFGGKWNSVNAYVYISGYGWHKFSSTYNGELFYQGNQFTDVTGGWLPTGYRMAPWNEGWGQASPKMDIGTNMTVYQESNPKFGTIFTSTMIDVTNYRTLKANVQYNLRGAGKNNGFWLGVCTNGLADQYTPLASFMAQTDTGEKSYDGDISIDISGITGRVFVFIAVVRHSHVSQYGTNPVTFRKIWLE